jgi:hypothetical protein
MTATPLPALQSGEPSTWDQALYAFLVEKGNRSGSHRTVESYSRMLWPFFSGRRPCLRSRHRTLRADALVNNDRRPDRLPE